MSKFREFLADSWRQTHSLFAVFFAFFLYWVFVWPYWRKFYVTLIFFSWESHYDLTGILFFSEKGDLLGSRFGLSHRSSEEGWRMARQLEIACCHRFIRESNLFETLLERQVTLHRHEGEVTIMRLVTEEAAIRSFSGYMDEMERMVFAQYNPHLDLIGFWMMAEKGVAKK